MVSIARGGVRGGGGTVKAHVGPIRWCEKWRHAAPASVICCPIRTIAGARPVRIGHKRFHLCFCVDFFVLLLVAVQPTCRARGGAALTFSAKVPGLPMYDGTTAKDEEERDPPACSQRSCHVGQTTVQSITLEAPIGIADDTQQHPRHVCSRSRKYRHIVAPHAVCVMNSLHRSAETAGLNPQAAACTPAQPDTSGRIVVDPQAAGAACTPAQPDTSGRIVVAYAYVCTCVLAELHHVLRERARLACMYVCVLMYAYVLMYVVYTCNGRGCMCM